jgi:hypothetical protein
MNFRFVFLLCALLSVENPLRAETPPLEQRVAKLERLISTVATYTSGKVTQIVTGSRLGSPPGGALTLTSNEIKKTFGSRLTCYVSEDKTEFFQVSQPPGSLLVFKPIRFRDLRVGDTVQVDFLPGLPTAEPRVTAFRLEVFDPNGPGGGLQ